MKKTVFISSTYKDLKECRTDVWNTIKKHQINITGMEKFGARKSSPLETCLEEVRRSDIFIVIIGMVYGSVEKSSGKSYTQLEYEEALKNNLDIYVYLVDEETSKFPLKHIDFVNHNELVKFKNELKKHTVDFFSGPKELSFKVNAILNKLTNNLIVKRPRLLHGKLIEFEVEKKSLVLYIGYLKGLAYEAFIPSVGYFLYELTPNTEKTCIVEEAEKYKGMQYYNLIFTDKEGYEITFPAINAIFTDNKHSNDYFNLSNAVTVLLNESKSLNEISDFLQFKLRFVNKFSEKVKNKVSELICDNLNQY